MGYSISETMGKFAPLVKQETLKAQWELFHCVHPTYFWLFQLPFYFVDLNLSPNWMTQNNYVMLLYFFNNKNVQCGLFTYIEKLSLVLILNVFSFRTPFDDWSAEKSHHAAKWLLMNYHILFKSNHTYVHENRKASSVMYLQLLLY